MRKRPILLLLKEQESLTAPPFGRRARTIERRPLKRKIGSALPFARRSPFVAVGPAALALRVSDVGALGIEINFDEEAKKIVTEEAMVFIGACAKVSARSDRSLFLPLRTLFVWRNYHASLGDARS